MKQDLLERIKWWICEKLGHFKSDSWEYENEIHFSCKCCHRVISKPIKGK